MKLQNSITITLPSITKDDGTVKNFNPITVDKLNITIIDNCEMKVVSALIRPAPRPLILWNKEDYDKIGDYTQAQIESRITELLGDNPASVLEGLFYHRSNPIINGV
ncbi:hypothetical protein EBZ38_11445 [bacterium]|nr:hypothetical protein [bacterium]NDC95096.1 hypothetical protein [bacterium]NDD84866.1 hypothetical protein [bacterium]